LGGELHSHEIADFAIHAVADFAHKLLFGTAPSQTNSERYRGFELQARAGSRNVLQESARLLFFAVRIGPAGLDYVCAQHANFQTPILHTIIISARRAEVFTGIFHGIIVATT
jgi:hypothetical protein